MFGARRVSFPGWLAFLLNKRNFSGVSAWSSYSRPLLGRTLSPAGRQILGPIQFNAYNNYILQYAVASPWCSNLRRLCPNTWASLRYRLCKEPTPNMITQWDTLACRNEKTTTTTNEQKQELCCPTVELGLMVIGFPNPYKVYAKKLKQSDKISAPVSWFPVQPVIGLPLRGTAHVMVG